MNTLPSPVAAYVAAANAQDADGVAGCFTADGTVHDEGTLRGGKTAIAAWARETAARYGFTIEPREAATADGRCQLTATVSGNFPGSPATLRFDFVLRPEGIAALEIAA